MADDLLRVAELEAKYADNDLGMVDASVIVACEKLDERKVATLDHRLGVVRPKTLRAPWERQPNAPRRNRD